LNLCRCSTVATGSLPSQTKVLKKGQSQERHERSVFRQLREGTFGVQWHSERSPESKRLAVCELLLGGMGLHHNNLYKVVWYCLTEFHKNGATASFWDCAYLLFLDMKQGYPTIIGAYLSTYEIASSLCAVSPPRTCRATALRCGSCTRLSLYSNHSSGLVSQRIIGSAGRRIRRVM
jgi:hypothetical protein